MPFSRYVQKELCFTIIQYLLGNSRGLSKDLGEVVVNHFEEMLGSKQFVPWDVVSGPFPEMHRGSTSHYLTFYHVYGTSKKDRQLVEDLD